MRSFTLFGAVACALLVDAQSPSATCDPTDPACAIAGLGLNSAAQSYLVQYATDPALAQAAAFIATDAAFTTATDDSLDDGIGLYSDYLAHATDVPTDSGLRDHFTSVVGNLLALQNGGGATAAPSASGSSGASASGSSGAPATGSKSGASAASTGAAASSMTSHAMAPAARQTGAAMYAAAGIAAGVAGLALGL